MPLRASPRTVTEWSRSAPSRTPAAVRRSRSTTRPAMALGLRYRGDEERHPEHPGQGADDPEAHGDLLLVPTTELEMVVERRHPKHPLAAELEAGYLNHVRSHLEHEDDADEGQDQDLACDQGYDGQHADERKRHGVSHEDLGRVNVEPQETYDRPDGDGGDHGQVGLGGLVENCDDQEADEREDERAAGQTVEPIGQVDAIAAAHDRENGHDDEQDGADLDLAVDQRDGDGSSALPGADEWDTASVEAEVVLDVDGDHDGHDQLPQDLVAAADADAGSGVQVVIDGAQGAYEGQHEERRIRGGVESVEDVGQDENDGDNEDAAHRGRALLDQVSPGAVLTDLLAHTKPAQHPQERRHEDDHAGEGE